MNVPRPVAIGHFCGADDLAVKRQRADVTHYAEAEGLALAGVLQDHRDVLTTSQIADTARQLGAVVVILLGRSRLAAAYTRVASELERHGLRCVLLGAAPRPDGAARGNTRSH